jgi:hypothetical protein
MNDSVMFDELVSLVRRYALTPSIIELANFSYFLERKQQVVLKMEFDDPGLLKRKTVVSQFALAFLSAQMTLRANDFRDKRTSYNDILLLCNRYNNLETKTEENPTILSFLVRISQEQIPFQEVGSYHFARGYYLINDVSKREGYKNPLDLDRIFLEWCGLNIEDYYWIAWCINSIGFGKEPPVFNKEFFIKHSVKGLEHILTSIKLDKFLDINSATIDKIKDENNQINAKIPVGFEKYQFNILSRYPIIRLGKTASNFTDKSFLVTNSKLMMNKVVDGVYWGLRDLFLSKSSNQQGFVNFWGEIFEKYVGEILIQYYGQGKVSNLDDIGHKLGCPISDWLVVTNEEIFVFECKSSLLPLSIKGVFDLPPKKWTQRRDGFRIKTSSKPGGVQWKEKTSKRSDLTGILKCQRSRWLPKAGTRPQRWQGAWESILDGFIFGRSNLAITGKRLFLAKAI